MAAEAPSSQELTDLVREQVEDVLRARGSAPFTLDDADRLEKIDTQMQSLLQDRSMGRILNGPLWLSGASVVNGTVTADKLVVNTLEAITTNTGILNVTGNITAAAAYPALTGARVVINASEIAGYNSSDVKTFSMNINGSGFFGVGATAMSWTTGGVLTVPAAAIGSLTIAAVGSGTFNGNFDAGTGRVRAGTAVQRVELTSAGLLGYNTSGVNTFNLSASTGSLDMTGTFSMKNAATGARVEIANVGLRAYNSGGSQTASFSSSDGSGFLGLSGGGFSWNSSGTVIIDGSLLVAGSITAGKLLVTSLSAISANLGTITAGSITAGTVSASTLTTGSVTFGSGGTINGTASMGGTFGGLNLANLGITGNLTLGSGGAIVDADGSTWTQSGITLVSAGSFGDTLQFVTSGGTSRGSIYADATALTISSANNSYVRFGVASVLKTQISSAGDLFNAGAIYPGRTSAAGPNQTSYYIDAANGGGGIISNGIGIGGMLGISSGNTINLISPGTGGSASNWSSGGQYFYKASDGSGTGATWVSTGYFLIQLGGVNYRVPFYANG